MPARVDEGLSAGESARVKSAHHSSAHGPESLYGGRCIPYRRSCEGQAGRRDDPSPTATGLVTTPTTRAPSPKTLRAMREPCSARSITEPSESLS